MYYNGEYTWQQFKTLESVKKLPLQEQVKHYHKYLADLSIQKSLLESLTTNTFQSFQSTAASAGGGGGEVPTASFTNILFATGSNSSSACFSASAFPQSRVIYYYTPSVLDLNDILYVDAALTTPATLHGTVFFSDTLKWYRVTGSTGTVIATGSCSSLTIPVGLGYNVDYISGTGSACISASSFPQFSTNYYLNTSAGCTAMDINCTLYTNSGLTAFAPSGSYSDGVKWFRVSGSGVIRSSGSCP